MISLLHKEEDRGKRDHGWLQTAHSFSFGDWVHPERSGFGALRVINDDRIAPKAGFAEHHHKDMEIITIVTRGQVTHKDSAGNSDTVKAGDVQIMSAGTGLHHSEHNEDNEHLELIQIWIQPKEQGITPRYEQRPFRFQSLQEGMIILVDPYGKEGLRINQDAHITYAALENSQLTYRLQDKNHGLYLFVMEGTVYVGKHALSARDALGLDGALSVTIEPTSPARLLLIEVPVD